MALTPTLCLAGIWSAQMQGIGRERIIRSVSTSVHACARYIMFVLMHVLASAPGPYQFIHIG